LKPLRDSLIFGLTFVSDSSLAFPFPFTCVPFLPSVCSASASPKGSSAAAAAAPTGASPNFSPALGLSSSFTGAGTVKLGLVRTRVGPLTSFLCFPHPAAFSVSVSGPGLQPPPPPDCHEEFLPCPPSLALLFLAVSLSSSRRSGSLSRAAISAARFLTFTPWSLIVSSSTNSNLCRSEKMSMDSSSVSSPTICSGPFFTMKSMTRRDL